MNLLKKFIPHLVAILVIFVVAATYFQADLKGKKIMQDDNLHFRGMAKESKDFKKTDGEYPLWTNSMFGGMPTYLITGRTKSNYINYFYTYHRPISFFMYMALGFYILMLVCGVNPWLSLVASLAYSLGSYFFIIIGAGHNTKTAAITYMAPAIAAILLAYKGNYLKAFILFSLAFTLQVKSGHYQIVYYTIYIAVIYGIFRFVEAFKEKTIPQYFKATGIIFLGGIMALGCNFSKLYTTYEYTKYSIRGKSELTEKRSELTAEQKADKTSGLNRSYITQWSMGVTESLSTIIPYVKGSSTASLPEDSKTFDYLKRAQGQADHRLKKTPYYFGISMYWGDQPVTSAVYFGAIVMFLFILSFFYIDPKFKWWIMVATILSYVLSWGKNMPITTDFFIDYVPMYNKFRTVSMILVIANLTIVLAAFLGLNRLLSGQFSIPESFKTSKFKINKDYHLNSLLISFLLTGGLCLILYLVGSGLFNFNSQRDVMFNKPGYAELLSNIVDDRISLFKADAFRSFIYIALATVAIFLFLKKKINKNVALAAISLFIIVDMWTVNKRFITNDHFKTKRQTKTPFKANAADKKILEDKGYYRVFDTTVDVFNTAATSYFHKSIGGYHAAKLKRYQELISHHIAKFNRNVLNMLNTKYIIGGDKKGNKFPQLNPDALGNAWFVDTLKIVENADAEIAALTNFNPKTTAFVDKRYSALVKNEVHAPDSLSTISLTKYHPDHMVYEANCNSEKAAIFSEIHYDAGWNAYIDGKPAKYFRTNYVLRGMIIPEGKHKIEFKFHPKSFYVGENVSMISSIILLLCLGGLILFESRKLLPKKN